jgi:hypothetical protein
MELGETDKIALDNNLYTPGLFGRSRCLAIFLRRYSKVP